MATLLLTIERPRGTACVFACFPAFTPWTRTRNRDQDSNPRLPIGIGPPNGVPHRTQLVTYGVPIEKSEDGSIPYRGDIKNPEIRITLPSNGPGAELIPGARVWLCDDAVP